TYLLSVAFEGRRALRIIGRCSMLAPSVVAHRYDCYTNEYQNNLRSRLTAVISLSGPVRRPLPEWSRRRRGGPSCGLCAGGAFRRGVGGRRKRRGRRRSAARAGWACRRFL